MHIDAKWYLITKMLGIAEIQIDRQFSIKPETYMGFFPKTRDKKKKKKI